MINKIIKFAVENQLFVYILCLIGMGAGYYSFSKLPIDAVPDITNTQVQINTPTAGLIPEEVERMVTFPIEFSMNGLPGVVETRSISRYGISQVTVVFEDDFDIFLARQLVLEKLESNELPTGLKPEIGPVSSGLGEIFHYSLSAKEEETNQEKRLLQLMELRSIQDWEIKPRLLSLKGITEVNTIGGHEKQFFIQPDIKRMTNFGIHFDDIEKAITETNQNVGGGYIAQTGTQLLVRGIGLLKNIKDIKNVVIKRLSSNKIIRIKDIATVQYDQELRTGAATVNGKESIIGTTFMLLGENSRSVAKDVGNKLEEIKKNLPNWVELKTLYDRSNMVQKTLGTVEHNLISGAILVMIFLILLVGDLRAALITSAIIPIALLITFILMKVFNVSGNLMSLGALDFGIIVDGAVIVVEACVHLIQKRAHDLGRNLTRLEIKETVVKASQDIRSAAGFGELIVIIVFIPLFALTGVEGKMFGPMALTFIFALVSALILSFTLVPCLCASFLSGERKNIEPKLLILFKRLYLPILNLSLKFKSLVITIGIFCIILGGILFQRLGSEFIPQLDEGDFAAQFIRPANISLDTSLKLQKLSEKVIKKYPQVKSVFARTGAAEVATDPMGVNISDTYIMLYEKEFWPQNDQITNKSELITAIKRELEESVPAQVVMFSQPVELRFNELLEGTRSKISAKIYGENLENLNTDSAELSNLLKEMPLKAEVESESQGKSPLLVYTPKDEVLAGLGVSSWPILDTINIALGGSQVGHIYEGVKKFPIVTRLNERARKSIETLSKLPVGIRDGFTIAIGEVADLNFVETYSSIARENSKRRVAVLINPEDSDIAGYVEQAKIYLADKLKLSTGNYLEWGGAFKNLERAKKKLYILIPLATLIIALMLYSVFKSYWQVILILLCAPMSLIGGVMSLMVMGLPFSISAGVGFIALIGISVLNGVVLVSYFNGIKTIEMDYDHVVREGSTLRLRPVLMTALTDIFGFLPMMFSSGLGAEVQKPLATVVVGGILSATILTLVFLPTFYSYYLNRKLMT